MRKLDCFRAGFAAKQQIPDTMTFALSTPFELGEWSLVWSFDTCIVKTCRIASNRIHEVCMRIERFEHVLSIGFPIGCKVQQSIRFDPRGEQVQKGRLNQTAFVMPFFGPGIWKVDVNSIQRLLRQCIWVARMRFMFWAVSKP